MKRVEVAAGAVVVAGSESVCVALYDRPDVNGIPSGMLTEKTDEPGTKNENNGTVVPAKADVES